jgi:hypothetical protein
MSPLENLLNYFETSMARASDDFYPKDMAAQTVHPELCVQQCDAGEVATTELGHVFHSKHPYAMVAVEALQEAWEH